MKTTVNKIKVTKEVYRAFHVNRVKDEFGKIRNASKTNTFALQYAGTPITLSKNGGFTMEEATQIYNNYHLAYRDSKAYADTRKIVTAKDGYATVAFGLRVRTPLLKQVMFGSSRVPYEAEAEARTVGNAFSQSYGMLNNRAAVAFMKKVWASPYRNDIKIVALIHDAIYLMIRDDLPVVAWVNKHLIDEMRWQELPEIQHDTVKLVSSLDIFWPDWGNPVTLPNDCDDVTILEMCNKVAQEYK